MIGGALIHRNSKNVGKKKDYRAFFVETMSLAADARILPTTFNPD